MSFIKKKISIEKNIADNIAREDDELFRLKEDVKYKFMSLTFSGAYSCDFPRKYV